MFGKCAPSEFCIPSVRMSVVTGVVMFVQVVCVGTLSCSYICIDWTLERIHEPGSMSTYII